jgi:hypothetical protein
MSKSRLFSKLIGSDGKVRADNVKEMMAHAGGVQTKSFGSSSLVPIITVDRTGKISNITTTAVAGVDSVLFNNTSGDLTINTSDGTTHQVNVVSNDPSFNSLKIGLLNVATESYVDTKISALIGDAPASMDTLAEIADSLGDDPDYATNLNIQAMNTAASIIDLQDKYITEHV